MDWIREAALWLWHNQEFRFIFNSELAKDNKVIAKYISFLNSANGGDNIAALSTRTL